MSEADNPRLSSKAFPLYLKPLPYSDELAKWLGQELKKIRSGKTLERIARETGQTASVLEGFEDGNFAINLGRLREILKKGYRTSLTKLLFQFYNANRARLDPDNKRPFERDSHYSVCLEGSVERSSTPFFMCGDSKSYVWAVPMRTLKKQPILTDLLELAPERKGGRKGTTPIFANEGVEVIYVIHGRVEIHIQGKEDEYSRKLRPGEFIHFRSSRPHRVANIGNSLSALVLIVRLPKNSESGKYP